MSASKARKIVEMHRMIEERDAEIERWKAVIFDGYRVLQALDEKAKKRTNAENVSDVLDAVARLLKA